MTKKYILEITEMHADYDDYSQDERIIGWTTDCHRLEFFETEEGASEFEMVLCESQDYDRKVEINRIGWRDVPLII